MGVLFEALGISLGFDFCPPFDHPRHLKSGVTPWGSNSFISLNSVIRKILVINISSGGGGRVLNKVGDVPSPVQNPSPFIYHFLPKTYPIHTPRIKTLHPFPNLTHFVMRKERQEVFSSVTIMYGSAVKPYQTLNVSYTSTCKSLSLHTSSLKEVLLSGEHPCIVGPVIGSTPGGYMQAPACKPICEQAINRPGYKSLPPADISPPLNFRDSSNIIAHTEKRQSMKLLRVDK